MNECKAVMQALELETAIRTGIPISAKMDFRVLELTQLSIKVSGGATENINVHNTAFAGSLSSICTLAAWGLTYAQLPKHCSLVMEKACIEYLLPVQGGIVAQATFTHHQVLDFIKQLAESGKARIELPVVVMNERQSAVKFIAYLYAKQHG